MARSRLPLLVAVVAAAAALAACGQPADVTAAPTASATSPTPAATSSASATGAPPPGTSASSATPSPASDETPTPTADPTATAPVALTDEELDDLGVNELGRVLVAQWHIIGDTDGEYRTSRDTLRAQLQGLYDRGYRPVTQAEFVAGTFPIPAGTSPVVLTFDDSTRGQLDLGDDGEPLPDTAVGIIEEFAADKPDWRPTAVFAYNFPEPFGDGDFAAELRWLVDNGYELSNHSVGHTNLASLSTDGVVANLADNLARLLEAVPDATAPSLTLPFGARAASPEAELAGTADGTTYQHELVYLVGSYPTRSPHHEEFDAAAVQRVPAHAVVGTGPEWFGQQLDWLDEPGTAFVSDGRPDVVTYPAALADVADVVDPTVRVRTY